MTAAQEGRRNFEELCCFQGYGMVKLTYNNGYLSDDKEENNALDCGGVSLKQNTTPAP